MLLPVIMEFNAPAALDKYVDIAKAMNVYTSGMSREAAAHAAVEAVKSLAIRVGIPQHLSELGIEEEDLERLSEAAFADVSAHRAIRVKFLRRSFLNYTEKHCNKP